MVDRKLSW